MEATLQSESAVHTTPAAAPAAKGAALVDNAACGCAAAGAAAEGSSGSAYDGAAWRACLIEVAADALAASRAASAVYLKALRRAAALLRRWLWAVVDFALEEFEPWFKWVLLDAALAAAVAALAHYAPPLRPLLELLGWA